MSLAEAYHMNPEEVESGRAPDMARHPLDAVRDGKARVEGLGSSGYLTSGVQEVRHTAASGGQKGRKAETYRLIPGQFYSALRNYADGIDSDLTRMIRWDLEAFWYELRNGKAPQLDRLLSAAALAEGALGGPVAARFHLARVYGLGALKYDDDNWRKGYPWSWSYDALHRHLEAIRRGELIDPEMGVPHWANVIWHCATLWTFATEGLGTDDRPRQEVK